MNTKAWNILLDEEKAALSLSINHSKSSWQAGEIMGKAHYKYLEIQARAKHFFKMFTNYYELTGGKLVAPGSEIRPDFKELLENLIEKRAGYRETLKKIPKDSPLNHRTATRRDSSFIEYVEELRDSKDPMLRELHTLVMEFDRWNNFRILPEVIQQPSAFKRRNKTRVLKHLKNLNNLDPFLIRRLNKEFSAKKSYKGKIYYLPIISDNFDKGYDIIRIKGTSRIVNYISKYLKLYLFKDISSADDYAFLVEQYLNLENKNCKQGQRFWPLYRKAIEESHNYNLVNNIIPRRNKLVNAFRDIDKIKLKKMK